MSEMDDRRVLLAGGENEYPTRATRQVSNRHRFLLRTAVSGCLDLSHRRRDDVQREVLSEGVSLHPECLVGVPEYVSFCLVRRDHEFRKDDHEQVGDTLATVTSAVTVVPTERRVPGETG